MKKEGNILLIGILLMGMMTGAGCNQANLALSLAEVTELQIQLLESFPLQANLDVKGYLPSPCYHIPQDKIEVSRKGNDFTVTIYQAFDKDKVCIQVLVDYRILVPLDIYGLMAGWYEVWVNGKKITFELKSDNQ